jgi:hypothetical protein
LKQVQAIGDDLCVVLDVLKEPPHGIPRVVTRKLSATQKVRDHAVLEYTGESQDMLLRIVISPSTHVQTSGRYRDVAAPATSPVVCKVRKTSCHTRNGLFWPKRGTVHVSGDLDADERQALEELLAIADILTHKLDSSIDGSVVRGLDDHSKVSRKQEVR